MLIHFVCTGNTYRSRLSETYLNSKKLPNMKATSSGITASQNGNGPISWYTQRIIQNDNLVPYESPTWVQTTNELLDTADYVVFLTPFHFEYSKEHFNYVPKAYEVWNIPDLDSLGITSPTITIDDEVKRIQGSEDTFNKIKMNVEDLITRFNT